MDEPTCVLCGGITVLPANVCVRVTFCVRVKMEPMEAVGDAPPTRLWTWGSAVTSKTLWLRDSPWRTDKWISSTGLNAFSFAICRLGYCCMNTRTNQMCVCVCVCACCAQCYRNNCKSIVKGYGVCVANYLDEICPYYWYFSATYQL